MSLRGGLVLCLMAGACAAGLLGIDALRRAREAAALEDALHVYAFGFFALALICLGGLLFALLSEPDARSKPGAAAKARSLREALEQDRAVEQQAQATDTPREPEPVQQQTETAALTETGAPLGVERDVSLTHAGHPAAVEPSVAAAGADAGTNSTDGAAKHGAG
jgi:hypothetical protein